MAFSTTDVQKEIVFGLNQGGQIPQTIIEDRLNYVMKHIFAESGILVLPRYIDEVSGQKIYDVDVSRSGVSTAHGITDNETERFLNLYSIDKWESTPGAVTDAQENVKTRTLIDPSTYRFEIMFDASHASNYMTNLVFNSKRTRTESFGLELWAVESTTEKALIPPSCIDDFRKCCTHYIKSEFLREAGKPWYEPNQATFNYQLYLTHLNKLRIKADRGFKGNGKTVAPCSFI